MILYSYSEYGAILLATIEAVEVEVPKRMLEITHAVYVHTQILYDSVITMPAIQALD